MGACFNESYSCSIGADLMGVTKFEWDPFGHEEEWMKESEGESYQEQEEEEEDEEDVLL